MRYKSDFNKFKLPLIEFPSHLPPHIVLELNYQFRVFFNHLTTCPKCKTDIYFNMAIGFLISLQQTELITESQSDSLKLLLKELVTENHRNNKLLHLVKNGDI